MFWISCKDSSLRPTCLFFSLKSASDSIVLYSFRTRFHNLGPSEEGVSMPYFVVRILFDLKCEVVRREYGFSINSKTSFISSIDKPFLTLKIWVSSFCRFRWWMCSKSYPLQRILKMKIWNPCKLFLGPFHGYE